MTLGDETGDARAVDPRRFTDMLAESPLAYAAMVESVTGFGIYLIDVRGNVLTWNHGAELQTGLKHDEVVRRPYAELFDDAGRAADLPSQILGFAKYHGHYSDEHWRRRGDDGRFQALATLDVVRDRQGEHTGFVEVVRDITADRKREAALHTQATTDTLTGLANREHFTEVAQQEIDRIRHYGDPLSVAVLDIDHFKSVNDTYGHQVGDIALKHVADILRQAVRPIDIIGRLGGEEFAIVMPRANTQPAIEFCNRIRIALYGAPVDSPMGPLKISVSIGVATRSSEAPDLPSLLERADKALCKAKRNGRNRVETWLS